MQDGRGRDRPETEPFGEATEVDPTDAAEQAEPYFPPTDPVVRQPGRGEVKIAGGFGSGELREGHVRAETEMAHSDEGLEDAIRAELALDASTAHLRVHVIVSDGVARLSGAVADGADAENALAVAGRVPGVVEVIDDLRGA